MPWRREGNSKSHFVFIALRSLRQMLVSYSSSPEPEAPTSVPSTSRAVLPAVAADAMESDEEVEFDPTDAFGLKQAPTTAQKSVASAKAAAVASAPDVMVLVSCFPSIEELLRPYSTRERAGGSAVKSWSRTRRRTKNGGLTMDSLAADFEQRTGIHFPRYSSLRQRHLLQPDLRSHVSRRRRSRQPLERQEARKDEHHHWFALSFRLSPSLTLTIAMQVMSSSKHSLINRSKSNSGRSKFSATLRIHQSSRRPLTVRESSEMFIQRTRTVEPSSRIASSAAP